jgi:hypothetical protein
MFFSASKFFDSDCVSSVGSFCVLVFISFSDSLISMFFCFKSLKFCSFVVSSCSILLLFVVTSFLILSSIIGLIFSVIDSGLILSSTI